MIYDWIQEFTGILTGSGYSQNSNIQVTACVMMLLIVIFMLWAIVKVLAAVFHWG